MKPARLPTILSLLAVSGMSVLTAQLAPRAIPIEQDNTPRAIPINPAPPRPEIVAEPNKPTGPDEDLFDYGTLAYSQKDYVIAAQTYGQYLSTYPQGRHVPDALYRLGECFRNQNRTADAERYYHEVVDRHPKTPAAINASYWLGALNYNNKDFKGAATYFGFCEAKSSEPKVKLAAAFYKSESYAMQKDYKRQLEALKPVLATKTDNQFLERALLGAATAHQSQGSNKLALPMLLELASTSQDPVVKGDATLKAAIIQSELKQPAEAAELFNKVVENQALPADQRGAALVGLIGELYAKGDYDAVIDTNNRNASLLPPTDLRPRMMMHVGNAHRSKKNYARAIDQYDMIEKYYPDHELAFEAAYWKVYCFYLLEDKGLANTADAFIQKYAEGHKDHEFIQTARLLVADFHFTKQNYKLAADAYAAMDVSKLQERFRASTLFHKGWSESEAGRHNDAITSLSQFIADNATSEDLPKALAKRGISHKESQNNAAALADFARIIKDYPQSEALELAYYLTGVIQNDQRNWQEMITAFEALLEKFTASQARAEAAYKAGIGYIELKNTDKALPLFRTAVKLDEKTYGNTGTQKILLCLWNKKDSDTLGKEVDSYRSKYADAIIPPSLLGYLGLTYFDRKDYNRSARYLTWASTPDAPANTDARIWNYLSQSLLELKSFEECIKSIDFYLADAPDSVVKAKALVTKASAQLGLSKSDEASATADEGLRIVKDGGVQGQLLILQGDALLAAGDKLETEGNAEGAKEKWRAAAGKYVVPSQVLKDDVVTPSALDKAAKALERLGEKERADALRMQLKREYPTYQVP